MEEIIFHFRAHIIRIWDEGTHRIKQNLFKFFPCANNNNSFFKFLSVKKRNAPSVPPGLPDFLEMVILVKISSYLRQAYCLVELKELRILFPGRARPGFNALHIPEELNISLKLL